MSKAARFMNRITGDVVEMPIPDELGQGVVLLNGQVIARALFSDVDGGSITLEDGRRFAAGAEFAEYLISLIRPKSSAADGVQ